MTANAIELDLEAQKLYAQFEGLEDAKQFYINEQQQLNSWRTAMVEFAYLLARTLNSYRVSETFIKNEDDFRPLLKRLRRMLEIPQRTKEHKLTIRHRGLGLVHHDTGNENQETQVDYVISCGDCMVDKPSMEYLVKYAIIDDPALMKKLARAFEFFALAGFYTIEIDLNDWSDGNEKVVSACLMCLARYINALAKDPERVVYNESNEPDPNLTILAKLNRFKRQDMEKLVRQIHHRFMK